MYVGMRRSCVSVCLPTTKYFVTVYNDNKKSKQHSNFQIQIPCEHFFFISLCLLRSLYVIMLPLQIIDNGRQRQSSDSTTV